MLQLIFQSFHARQSIEAYFIFRKLKIARWYKSARPIRDARCPTSDVLPPRCFQRFSKVHFLSIQSPRSWNVSISFSKSFAVFLNAAIQNLRQAYDGFSNSAGVFHEELRKSICSHERRRKAEIIESISFWKFTFKIKFNNFVPVSSLFLQMKRFYRFQIYHWIHISFRVHHFMIWHPSDLHVQQHQL